MSILIGIGKNLRITPSGGFVIPAPFSEDILFFLNGDIITIGADKYFEDKTTNGRNFLITNYDFNVNWTVGFPYKSAATISAPAGDAVLIAADVNNYLYDIGGTPNQIYVTVLYQDIDYKNKLFCRHAAQVLDDEDNQIYEPRVLEIVLYNTVKTGADLITCQTYYGVPAEDGAAKYVDTVNGNDGADGSKVTPYKTLTQALTTATTVIYMMTGETDMGAAAKTVNKNVQGIGLHKITNLHTTAANWTVSGTETYVKGLYFASGYGPILAFATANTIIQSCYFEGHTSYGIMFYYTVNISNCIIKGTIATKTNYDNANITITNCLYNASGASKRFVDANKVGTTITTKYNKANSANYGIYGASRVLGNIVSYGNTGNWDHYIGCASTPSVISKHDNLIATSYYINCTANIAGDVDIYKLIVSCNSASEIIALKGNDLTIEKSLFIQSGGGGHFDLVAAVNPAVWHVSGSVFVSKNTSGGPLSFGDSSFGTVNNGSGYFKNNLVLGNGLYVETPTSSHGVANWGNDNFEIANNFIDGWALPIVQKGPGHAIPNSSVHHNIIKNGALTLKGMQELRMYNNIFFINNNKYNHNSEEYSPGVNSINNVFKNNILISNYDYNFHLDTDQTIICDYNIYYNPTGNMKLGQTFAQWQLTGQDVNSLFLTLEQLAGLLNDPDNDIFSLKVGSVAIGIGEDLGASFDDGLDEATDWGSETELTAVVTKQQGANWDIGAYIH